MGGCLTRMVGRPAAGAASNPYGLVGVSSSPGAIAGSGAQTIDVPYPAGIAAGDIGIVEILLIQGTSPVSYGTLPTGWAEYAHHAVGGGAYHHYMFWKRLAGTESGNFSLSMTVAGGTSSLRLGMMSAWGGCVAAGDPFDNKVNNEGISTNCVSATLTTANPNEIVVNLVARSEAAPTFTPPGTYSEGYDVNTTAGFDGALSMNYKTIASAGSVAASTTVASSSGRYGVISFGLIPA